MEPKIEMRQYREVIKKRRILIVLLPVIIALAGGVVSWYLLTPIYRASTTLIVGKKASDIGQGSGQMLDYDVLLANQQLAKTYAMIVKSHTVEQKVLEDLGLPYTVEELDKMISVNSIKNTDILEIQVETTSPGLSASIANSMALEFADAVIEIKKVDSVSTVDRAMAPDKPVKPKKILNVLIAYVAGLLGALSLAFFLEHMDNTLKSAKGVEKLLGISVLAQIPKYKIKRSAKNV
jgi:capsular polysaccharide biosynthesis protein